MILGGYPPREAGVLVAHIPSAAAARGPARAVHETTMSKDATPPNPGRPGAPLSDEAALATIQRIAARKGQAAAGAARTPQPATPRPAARPVAAPGPAGAP